ncbi:MAG: amino acid adenylation domain-containing protein [Ignavibacteria bacterium]|nr:amino acid adenylation domain-containing protein [Ignavibacteria bacterium]
MIVKNKTVIDFLIEADEKGMSVFLENGNLKYTLDKNKPSDTEFISALKSRKSEIIEFLSSGSGDFNLINAPVEKITPADRAGTAGLPLSFSQEQIWFIDRLEGSIQYHLPAVLRLSGKLNKNALEKALQNIVNRHEVLRTVIQETEGKAYQLVKENYNWKLKFVDGSKFKDKEEKLKSYIKDLINIPFDLSEDPMMRGHLISINDDDHRLVITLHHIASDGWSLSIFVKELVELYESYEKNREDNLTPLPIQYADYAIWQRNYLQGEVLEKKLDYWKEKLRGSEPLQLATDYNRPAVQSTKGSVAGFSFDKELSESLQTLSQQQGATLFMTLLSAINILLYRYSGQSDICVGSPVAGRQQKETEELIGFFINTLVMRSEVNSDDSFTEFLQQIKATTLSAYEHQDVPFEKVVDSVVKQRDISRSPLFQVMFMLQNTPDIPELRLGDVKLHSEISEQTTSKFDLAFSMAQTAKGISGTIEYCADLYHEKTILRMIGHFEKLIRSIVAEPEKSIGMMRMLGIDEEQQLLSEFRDKNTDYPKDKTIIDLFEAQVLKTPDNIALVFEDKHLTYLELNECSNQLAHYLRSKGVKTETLVPICIGRSMEMITGILGILKAGGVYVPVDPDYPEERIKFILEDTAANVVVTGKEVSAKLSDRENTNIIEIDGQWSEISAQPKDNLKTSVKPDNPAYIIYTSGSTGKPKGVMIAHNNVVSLFKTEPPVFDFNEKDVWTMFHSFCFDFSVWEMYGALFYGGRLVIVPKQITKDASLFSEFLLSEKVTVLNQTPSSFYVLQDILTDTEKLISVRYVIFGGEALNPSKLQAWKQTYPDCKLINMYGITETTVHVTYTEIEWDNIRSGKSIIGKPIPSLGIYILDSNQNLLPSGIAGELCIAGAGLSRGYLNLPELTKEKFINNPFSEEPGARLYRSGDLGIRSEDSNIEYLGRIDEQVKIRGFRIELGEIESVLQESESVRQSVVLARDTEGGGKRLVGYVVPEGDFNKEAIMIYLSSRLPEYMVPALWVELESLPLTQNGKTDRKALPDPDASELISNEYAAPRNETEESLAEIWKELLHVERVGIHDNFFELGGDSIITIQVVSRARRKGFELKPRDIFIHQTISKLSAAIAERTAVSVSGEQGLLTGTSGLLPIQQWYFEGAGDEGSRYNHFNQSVLLSIDKSVTPEVLSLAVDQLIVQHDALRFRYYKKDEQWIQEYGTYKGELEIIDLRLKRSSLAKFIKEHAEKYQRSPDIEKGELVRFVLIQTPKRETNNRILIIIHHLAVDGVSWRILLEDLELLITGLEKGSKPDLGNKGSSYRQWYEALEQYGKSKRLLSQSKYWQEVVSSYEPLAADKVYTGIVREKDMVHQTIRLDKVQTQLLLQEVPRAYHTEINDILLCALEMTLCEWTDREKIVIGLEGHGRENVSEGIDTGRTAGWFTNLYPVLLESGLSKGVGDRISSVKEQLRRIPDKGLGYGVLKYINKDEKLSGKAWEIVFNYLGQLDNVISSGKWLSGAGESSGEFTSEENIKSETLSVNGMVQEGELILNWSYSSRHYEKKTIAAIVERYQSNLELLISHCIEQQKSGTVYTPSDYGLGSDISNDELDRFLSEPFRGKTRRESVEELYKLSGLQEGMLFHALYDSRAGSYIEQLVCDLKDPQPEFIRKSWNHIIKSHSILRSGFYYDEFNVPVQCVYSEVEIPVTILDYRDKNSEEQKSLLIDYERADRDKGFDFKSVPLMRIALIRLSEDRYRMIWTSHHILFDGWSFPILMGEFLSNYELLITGKELPAATEDRYEDFIRYIERGDKDRQEQYWRNYMQGIEQSTLLPFIETTALRTKGVGEYDTIDLNMDAETTGRIGRYVQKHHLTINTLIQGVWSYLLHCYTGNDDVVFGVIVSGRPDDLPGIEQRVGMYINTLPLHSTLKKEEKITEWLQNLQKDQVSSRQYQHTPLQDVQSWTSVSGDLFDSLLVFENYPVGEIIGSKEWSLQVENFQVLEQTNYPLTILIGSGEEINFKFSYNAGVLKREHVNEIRGHFENVFNQIITNEESTLNDIELLTKRRNIRY